MTVISFCSGELVGADTSLLSLIVPAAYYSAAERDTETVTEAVGETEADCVRQRESVCQTEAECVRQRERESDR